MLTKTKSTYILSTTQHEHTQGAATANTALLWHHRQLYALCEGDQPYLLHVAPDGRVETARRVHKGERAFRCIDGVVWSHGYPGFVSLVRSRPTLRTDTYISTAGPPDAWFTAHPKVDPATRKLYAFGYSLERAPYLTFYQMDAEGREVRSVPLGFTRPCMTHDFFITEHYAVFLEGSLYLAPEVGPPVEEGMPEGGIFRQVVS